MQPLLELQDLTKAYQSRPVLDGVNLQVYKGEFFSLLGPSGCGKSSTLRMIAGFETPDRGTILGSGRVWNNLSVGARDCNMVFQSYALFPHMNVWDNVAFGLRMQKRTPAEIDRLCAQALDLVKMQGYAKRLPNQLSGGQQQRVALARAIAPQPALLLLDEPLSALDKSLRQEMQSELKQLQRQLQLTFLFVTHDQDEAMALSDRMAIMDRGKILQVGSPEQIYEHPTSKTVATFLGEADFFSCTAHDGILRCQATGLHFPRPDTEKANSLAACEILVRPEFWCVRELASEGSIQAQIETMSYRGRDRIYSLSLAGGRRINALVEVSAPFSIGDRVSLSLKQRSWKTLDKDAP